MEEINTQVILFEEPEYRSRYREYPMGWTGRGSNPDKGKRFFSSPQRPDGLRGSFLGARRPQREVSHSPNLVQRLRKREWSYTFTLSICLHGVDRDTFTAPMDPFSSFFSVSCSDYGVTLFTTHKTGTEDKTHHYGAFS